MTYFELIFMYIVMEVIIFSYTYPIAPSPLIETIVVFPLNCFCTKINWPYICIYFYIFSSVPLDCLSIFVAVAYWLHYCSFIIRFKVSSGGSRGLSTYYFFQRFCFISIWILESACQFNKDKIYSGNFNCIAFYL